MTAYHLNPSQPAKLWFLFCAPHLDAQQTCIVLSWWSSLDIVSFPELRWWRWWSFAICFGWLTLNCHEWFCFTIVAGTNQICLQVYEPTAHPGVYGCTAFDSSSDLSFEPKKFPRFTWATFFGMAKIDMFSIKQPKQALVFTTKEGGM